MSNAAAPTPYQSWEIADLKRALASRAARSDRSLRDEWHDEEVARLIATVEKMEAVVEKTEAVARAATVKDGVPVFELPASDPLAVGLAELWMSLRGGGTYRQTENIRELKAAGKRAIYANPLRLEQVMQFLSAARAWVAAR